MQYKTSQYNHVEDKYSKDYDFDTWLKQTIEPPESLRRKVEKYRETLDKEDKAKLPLITVSARCKGIRNLENIEEHLPFICIDIDRYSKKGRKNLCVDMQLVKELFMDHPSTYFCGFSVTLGDGVYAIMKLNETGKLDKYFEMLRDKLSIVGINIDESCKDATRLRFFSHDPDAYYNPDAKPLMLPVKRKPLNTVILNPSNTSSDYEKVSKIVDLLEERYMDITQGYDEWIKIGSVLNNNFGENGRALFHRISKLHPEYEFKKCDDKYNHCRKMKLNSIGTIINLCKDYGVL